MSKSKSESSKTKRLLLPMAIAGMVAGFSTGCSEEKPAAPSASKPAAAKSDAKPTAEKAAEMVAGAKHACKGMNSCKGQGG